MAGEIHGIISRQEAWEQWSPYGARVSLDGAVDPSTLTNQDALHILIGSDKQTASEAYGYWYDESTADDGAAWYEGLLEIDLERAPELVALLTNSQVHQQASIERRRAKAIEQGTAYTAKLDSGLINLRDAGLLTPLQARTMQDRLLGADGQPFLQYTPMTQLEYARLARQYDHSEVDLGSTDNADFCFGILRAGQRLYGHSKQAIKHGRAHESVHGISGLELHDITRDDGWRRPEATVVGAFAYSPTTEVIAGDDYSDVEDVEITEGWTDFIARQLLLANPLLGKARNHSQGYDEWAQLAANIATQNPDLFRAITDAMLADATPEQPNTKREAIAQMHKVADRELGKPNSLNTLFQAGGRILDIYTKGTER